MKICFPVEADRGIESDVFGHFGSAPHFVVVDSQDNSVSTINNQDLGHEHGKCSPMKALDGKMVDVIIVGGIGAGAVTGLNRMGIKVYRAIGKTVQDNLGLYERNVLSEMTLAHTCGGHAEGCAHL